MRILFVENHAVFAEIVIAEFLSEHEITVVPSLSEARQVLGHGQFDVCLVDYDLDDGKGNTLVSELVNLLPALLIVAVSSHDFGNAALQKAGAHAVCAKPDFARIASVLASLTPQPSTL